ncbi:MAG: hypothetical protein ABL949_13645 [Fimbriimonadaceae bacterium]
MSNKGDKLFDAMCRTKTGWKSSDFKKLFSQFGFESDTSGKDIEYTHPDHSDLVCYVSKSSGDLATGYAVAAVKIIKKLKERITVQENPKEPENL